MDNSIEIDASPVMHDNNWIGVVCCAIFHTGNGSEREMSYPRTKYFCPENPPIELRSDVVIDHSDHMWLFILFLSSTVQWTMWTEFYNTKC